MSAVGALVGFAERVLFSHEPFYLLIKQGILAVVLALLVLAVAGFLAYYKRKYLGDACFRIGPNRVGPFGIFTILCDAAKMLAKEDIVNEEADRWTFNIAPVALFGVVLLPFVVIPFSKWLVFSDMDVGLIYLYAVAGLSLIPVMMAGYGSNNKWATISMLRGVGQMISYEIPLVVSALAVALAAGTLNLNSIVMAQQGTLAGFLPKWFIFTQPLGFVVFTVALVAEIMRNPFDLVEAESELVAGYMTEYSAFKFGLVFMGEFVHILVASSLLTTLFLGGWLGPAFLPGVVWFLIKAVIVVNVVYLLNRVTHPRVRPDQLIHVGWKGLLVVAFFNLVLTAGVMAVVS